MRWRGLLAGCVGASARWGDRMRGAPGVGAAARTRACEARARRCWLADALRRGGAAGIICRHNGTTAQRHNGTTAQRHNGTTAQRHNGTAAQRHGGTAAQRHNGTTAQRHGGTAARRRDFGRRVARLPANAARSR
ncbi:hypothetical protein DO65_5538 [Burkholderia pseudomallei]|nr:hypothetical protein DO65_5538 [Burkholderia pseudomallei]